MRRMQPLNEGPRENKVESVDRRPFLNKPFPCHSLRLSSVDSGRSPFGSVALDHRPPRLTGLDRSLFNKGVGMSIDGLIAKGFLLRLTFSLVVFESVCKTLGVIEASVPVERRRFDNGNRRIGACGLLALKGSRRTKNCLGAGVCDDRC